MRDPLWLSPVRQSCAHAFVCLRMLTCAYQQRTGGFQVEKDVFVSGACPVDVGPSWADLTRVKLIVYALRVECCRLRSGTQVVTCRRSSNWCDWCHGSRGQSAVCAYMMDTSVSIIVVNNACTPGGQDLLERFEQLPASRAAHQGIPPEVVFQAAHHLNYLVSAAALQDVCRLADLHVTAA